MLTILGNLPVRFGGLLPSGKPPAGAPAQLQLARFELSNLVRSCPWRFGYYAADERASPSSVRRVQSEVRANAIRASASERSKCLSVFGRLSNKGSDGVAYIEGTRTKVIEVALDQIAYDWDAAEIHRQYPYLSLPQIHAALGFYYENRSECDRLIDQQVAEVDQWREQSQNASLSLKLRARRQKPGC